MRLKRFIGAAILAALALTAASVPGAAGSWGPNDLIPRRVIFGNPERVYPVLSPDGSKIAFSAPLDGVMNIWIAPADDIAQAKPITSDKQRPIMKYWWAPNGTHLLYMQDQAGNENYHLYAVDLATGATRDLTPYKDITAYVFADSYERPDELLIGINNRDKRWHDAWLVNVVTGAAKLVQKNDGFSEFRADNDLNIRLAAKPRPDGGEEYLKLDDGEWKPFLSVPGDDALTTKPKFVTKDGKSVVMLDSRGRDKSALVRVDLRTGKSTLIAEPADADISEIIYDPVSTEVLAYASEYDRLNWTPLDDEVKADIAFLSRVIKGRWWVMSQSKDNDLWTLWIDEAGEPVKSGLYDRRERSLKILFSARPNLVGAPLPKMHARVIEARDGLKLVSYLTLPKQSDPDGNGVPEKPLPMVLMVHGGPWYRDSFAYNPPAAWLANRGYAVLSVNFRGSTGLGKAFVNAGDREWGGKMQDDLLDAVGWAIDKKIARKDKIAIYGASYGGYAALVGLIETPEKFACGVNIVGPSNLNTMIANIPPYWVSFIDTFKRRVGDPSTPEGRALLKERSPLFRADKIKRPLLIAQGANDPRVKQSEADQIVRAVKRNRAPVTYALYADEGHGFARPENRLSFYAIAEAFLGRCLGGRVEPIGKDFEGSSVAVPSGKEHIKGLKEALAGP